MVIYSEEGDRNQTLEKFSNLKEKKNWQPCGSCLVSSWWHQDFKTS
jgi:hypothetical protein